MRRSSRADADVHHLDGTTRATSPPPFAQERARSRNTENKSHSPARVDAKRPRSSSRIERSSPVNLTERKYGGLPTTRSAASSPTGLLQERLRAMNDRARYLRSGLPGKLVVALDSHQASSGDGARAAGFGKALSMARASKISRAASKKRPSPAAGSSTTSSGEPSSRQTRAPPGQRRPQRLGYDEPHQGQGREVHSPGLRPTRVRPVRPRVVPFCSISRPSAEAGSRQSHGRTIARPAALRNTRAPMAGPRTVLVVNPQSQNGTLGRRWPELARRSPP